MNEKPTLAVGSQNPFALSRKLTAVAILLWAASIFLPGLVFYGQSEFSKGISILLSGWIGILGTYVAWYANIFWFVAIIRLWIGTSATITSALIAVILSLDTFRVDCVSMGGPCQSVYGIGIGAIVWMTAIFLVLVAAVIRQIEADTGGLQLFIQDHRVTNKYVALFPAARKTGHTWSLVASLALLVGLIGTAVTLGIQDRLSGNADELEKLNHSMGVFKRSKICNQSPLPENQILINGPLELIIPKQDTIISPEALLSMGVPVVRVIFDQQLSYDKYLYRTESSHQCRITEAKHWKEEALHGEDYSLEDRLNPKSIKIRDPEAPSAARLTIEKYSNTLGNNQYEYHILLESREGIIGFNQVFRRDKDLNIYCPNLGAYGEMHYSLDKLIRQTLAIPTHNNSHK